jgi:hypothetical protein
MINSVLMMMGMHFIVDCLLLSAVYQWSGENVQIPRVFLASAFGAAYAYSCLQPGLHFLGNMGWMMVMLTVVSVIAFGICAGALVKGIGYAFIFLIMSGLAEGLHDMDFWTLILCAAVVLLAFLLRSDDAGRGRYASVTIEHHGAKVSLMALRDTGNFLRDPVTGQDVLIVDQKAGTDLLGLTAAQLADPIGTVASGAYPGLRLIPFSALGTPGSLLLAIRVENLILDGVKMSKIVAFAPHSIGEGQGFRALAGGNA